MVLKIKWNEHEEAILLSALIKVLNHEIERKQAIKSISLHLRDLAKKDRIAIDDKFRNENGIALQMSKLEYVYTNGRSGMRVDSGWYFSIVQIYRNNYQKYMELLGEGMETSDSNMTAKLSFSDWIKENCPEGASEILSSLNVLSLLLVKNKTIKSGILHITDIEEIESLIQKIQSNKGINLHSSKNKKAYLSALRKYKNYLQYLFYISSSNTDESDPTVLKEPLNPAVKEEKSMDDDALIVSFLEERDYRFTRPKSLEYFGTHYNVHNWTQAYVQLVKCLFNDFPHKISSLRGRSIRGRGRTDLTDEVGSDAMIDPREIARGLYLETNESAKNIVIKSGMLLEICDVDFNDVKIVYAHVNGKRNLAEAAIQEVAGRKTGERQKNVSFYDWLTKNCGMTRNTGKSYTSAINTAAIFARDHNIGNGMLRETNDISSVSETINNLFQTPEFVELDLSQHNRLRSALRKYMQYLSGENATSGNRMVDTDENYEDVDFTPYRELLLEKFPKGFRIDSGLSMGRFRSFWDIKYKTKLAESDESVRNRINHITIRHNDFVYLPEMMMSEQTSKKILAYITDCFQDGKAAIYFDALYKEFENEFEGKRINNPEMLKSYLSFANNGRFHIHKHYLTKDAHTKVDPTDEVRDYMITIGIPVTVDDLKAALSHINEDAVYRAVAGSHSAEFVRNQKGEYFHADIIRFTQQEMDTIIKLIQHAIDDKDYMGGKELTDAIETTLPSVVERYPFLETLGLRDVIGYKLRDRFSFNGKIISAYGQDLSMADVFAHFARTRDHFTLAQLNALKRDLGTPIYFDSVYDNSLRINADEFVSRNQAAFDIEETDAAISRFCTGDYIMLQDISFFGSFPDAGFPWNGFLLEHYVADFSKDFKLLHSGFTAGKPVGGIVRRSSRYNDFDELLSAELAASGISLGRENALQYLVDSGLLARKNYGKIEQVLSTAKQQRLTKGK